jgi:hypothetical protein
VTGEPAVPGARRRRGLEIAIGAAFAVFLGWAVVRQWPRVEAVIGQLSAPVIAGSAAAALAGIWCSFLSWRAVLADFGSQVPLAGGMRIFFLGQAGKYVPGKVWPILAQVRLGRDYQVPGRASAAAAVVFLLIVLGSALLVGVCLLPVLGAGAVGPFWWVLLALPVALVVLWPPVLNRLLAQVLRWARRDPLPQPLSAAGIGRAVGWALGMWLLYGVHLWALLAALGADAPALLLRSTGAFAAAWAIGFLLVVAPAGFGPREIALVVLLGSVTTGPAALVAAVVSRLVLTLGDLAWAVVGFAAGRARRPAAAPAVRDGR